MKMNKLSEYDLHWCLRRVPNPLRKTMEARPGRVFIAGGFVRSCIAEERINDIDVFVGSVAEAHSIKRSLGGSTITPVETDNAITLRNFNPAIQIIHRWTFPTIESLVSSFDFTCCRAAIGFVDGAWVSSADERFYQDLAAKRLVYCEPERVEDAGGSILRVLKFYQRGYRIPLDSYAAVIARLVSNICIGDAKKEILARLHEVDPSVDPTHASHLPITAPAEEAPRGSSER